MHWHLTYYDNHWCVFLHLSESDVSSQLNIRLTYVYPMINPSHPNIRVVWRLAIRSSDRWLGDGKKDAKVWEGGIRHGGALCSFATINEDLINMQHDTSEEKKCSNRIYFFDFARHFQIVQGEELYLVILNFCSFLALNSQGETLPQICEKIWSETLLSLNTFL